MAIYFILFVPITKADIQDNMNDFFDTIITPPSVGSLDAQKMGYVSLGNLSMRPRQTNPVLWNVNMPTLDVGCNGIDVNFGSLSFMENIDVEQLIRQIAASAGLYAFQLGVEAMCPTCASNLKSIQKQINEWGRFLQDSCQIGKSIVNNSTDLKDWHDDRIKKAQIKAANSGGGDVMSYVQDYTLNGLPFSDLLQNELDEMKGNVLWNALEDVQINNWYGVNMTSQEEIRRMLMSLTGTLVVTDGTMGGEAVVIPVYLPPTISVQDFLNGNPLANVYLCDEPVECKGVRLPNNDGERVNIVGMRSRVSDLLDNILNILRAGMGDITNASAEGNLVNVAPLPVYHMLKAVAHENQAAEGLKENLSELLALSITNQLIKEQLKIVEDAIRQNDDEMIGVLMKHLNTVKQEMKDNRDFIAGHSNMIISNFNTFVKLRTSLKRNTDILKLNEARLNSSNR